MPEGKKKSGCAKGGCLFVLLLLIGALILGWLIYPQVPTAPVPQAGRPAGPPPAQGRWNVEHGQSQVDDSKTVVLSLNAESAITAWPAVVHVPTLILRCQEKKTEAYITTGAAPVVESGNLDGATVLLRFDKDNAAQYNASKSTDGKALFLPSPIARIKTMAAHERMLFRFTPFNSNPQETEFDLRGLDKVLPELAQTCGWKP
jgi:type VI secretion system protein VasI